MADKTRQSELILFIDETGKFQNLGARVFVAGVLVECESEPSFIDCAKRAISEIAPLAPWPLHGFLLKQSAAHAIWAIHQPELAKRWGAHEPALAAEKHWRSCSPRELERALSKVAGGKEPCFGDLQTLRDRARRMNAYAFFENQVTRSLDAIRRVGHDLWPGHLHAFVAGESENGDGCKEGDRYLAILGALIERVDEWLSRREDPRRVRVLVATRQITHPILGPKTKLDRSVLSKAFGANPSGFRSDRVFEVGAIQGFDADVHPGVVLADLLANMSHSQIKSSSTLDSVNARMACAIGLRIQDDAPAPPQLAAYGRAARWLARERAESGSSASLDAENVWAREQAEQLVRCW